MSICPPNSPIATTPLQLHEVIHFIDKAPSTFMTITLKPKLYKYSSLTQLELTNNVVFGYLYACVDDFICVAEHTANGNIHYHAIIQASKSQKILLINKLKKERLLGFIKLEPDTIRNPLKCSEYITKDVVSNSKIFRSVQGHNPDFIGSSKAWRQNYEYNKSR